MTLGPEMEAQTRLEELVELGNEREIRISWPRNLQKEFVHLEDER